VDCARARALAGSLRRARAPPMAVSALLDAVAAVVTCARPIRIACVGDSNTAGFRGVWSAPSPHSYPAELQHLLGPAYEVVNLGESGATLSQTGQDGADDFVTDAAYSSRPSYARLVRERWDVVVVM
jgi:lysophospholipase L1-like esterase